MLRTASPRLRRRDATAGCNASGHEPALQTSYHHRDKRHVIFGNARHYRSSRFSPTVHLQGRGCFSKRHERGTNNLLSGRIGLPNVSGRCRPVVVVAIHSMVRGLFLPFLVICSIQSDHLSLASAGAALLLGFAAAKLGAGGIRAKRHAGLGYEGWGKPVSPEHRARAD